MQQGLSHNAGQSVGPPTVPPPPYSPPTPSPWSAAGALRATPSHSWALPPLGWGPKLPGPFQKLSKPLFSKHSCASLQCHVHPSSSAPLSRPHGIGARCPCDVHGLREQSSCLGPHPQVWESGGRCSRSWTDRLSQWPL